MSFWDLFNLVQFDLINQINVIPLSSIFNFFQYLLKLYDRRLRLATARRAQTWPRRSSATSSISLKHWKTHSLNCLLKYFKKCFSKVFVGFTASFILKSSKAATFILFKWVRIIKI
jgi:hypothetical protein